MAGALHKKTSYQPPRKGPGAGLAEELQTAFRMYQGGRPLEAERLFLRLRRLAP